mmetsp:Transcript_10661/g.18691  ORF Transcript_10661/g.18691 Transcript_10661/m.18691 type:complete len:94 (-) Transcript_10661:10-291(-)
MHVGLLSTLVLLWRGQVRGHFEVPAQFTSTSAQRNSDSKRKTKKKEKDVIVSMWNRSMERKVSGNRDIQPTNGEHERPILSQSAREFMMHMWN